MEITTETAKDTLFNARGIITIHTSTGTDLDTAELREALRKADDLFPWKCNYSDGTPAPSMKCFSPKIHEGEHIDREYEFEFRPPFLLKMSQLKAYQNYVLCLARCLAEQNIEKVLRVSGRANFLGTMEHFKPEKKENE